MRIPAFPNTAGSGTARQADSARLEETLDAAGWDHSCGIYILLLPDFTEYGYSDIYEFAQDVYEDSNLGVGDGGDGILLAVSTETRDVSIAVHGTQTNAAITDYGREEVLYDAFLSDFSDGNWGAGLVNFADTCVYLLSEAQSGTPVEVSGGSNQEPFNLPKALGGAAVMCFLPAAIIAFVICGVMKKKMKTAQKASGAAAYVSGSVDLKVRTDHYTHSTVLRTPLKTDDGPRSGGSVFHGGTTVNSRGFSGSSRKF